MKSSSERNKNGAGKGDAFRGNPKAYREGLARIFKERKAKR